MKRQTHSLKWLSHLNPSERACFFYTTCEELLELVAQYFNDSFASETDQAVWILPPGESRKSANRLLQEHSESDIDTRVGLKQLILIPWDEWFGQEVSTQSLLKLGRCMEKDALANGFERIRFLSHAPAKSSPYWKDFLAYEETVVKRRSVPHLSLTAFSLRECPATAIAKIAAAYHCCFIHYGSDWEWIENKVIKSIAFPRFSG